ncbi:cupin domain-containing protein [Sphingobium yanoikuyae]|uniref:cupin domain-containing protein n=1 Tax=Sphingobium yanoikuyae TaxID=13690 RepID=UPI0028B22F50|nr:cupin domain-containing protein [Sphingobium yanoikuyae]
MTSSAPSPSATNLLAVPAGHEADELFEDLLQRPGFRIERIISHGHSTPPDQPYVQHWDEWVMLLEGTAELRLDGVGDYALGRGDHLLIPAGIAHWVLRTDSPTIWLAIHADAPATAVDDR